MIINLNELNFLRTKEEENICRECFCRMFVDLVQSHLILDRVCSSLYRIIEPR